MHDTIFDRVSSRLTQLIARNAQDADRAFFDPAAFPWLVEVERAYPRIDAELGRLLEYSQLLPAMREVSKRQEPIAEAGWKTCFLYVFGRKVRAAAELCPETTNVIEKVPSLRTAVFSMLQPGTRIPPHVGPHKGVLRYHLGLRVPDQNPQTCALRCKGETRTWANGRGMLFDDTFEHEAWNLGPEPRVVLFLDFLRPLPALPSLVNRTFVELVKWASSDVRSAHRNAERFSQRLVAAREQGAEVSS